MAKNTFLEIELPEKELDEFRRLCAKASVNPSTLVATFISAVNEHYAESPPLLREFSADKFFPAPIVETVYRFNRKTGKIERIGLTEKGKVLKLEEASPQKVMAEVKMMQASIMEYFKYLEDK
jgi:hypothetical protein